jgi:hypothetical protein
MLSFVYITRTYLPAEARPKAVAPLAVVLFSVESELNYDPVEFVPSVKNSKGFCFVSATN